MTSFKYLILIFLSIIILILIFRMIFKGKLYFTNYYMSEKQYEINEDKLKELILYSLKKSNFKKIKENDLVFSAITLPTMSSFSELININILKTNDGKFNVQFVSRCLFPLQIFEWGKNKKNTIRFFNNLNSKSELS